MRFPVFPLGDFRLCWPMGLRKPRHDAYNCGNNVRNRYSGCVFSVKDIVPVPLKTSRNPFLNLKLFLVCCDTFYFRRFQWYIAEGMLSLPTAKWSMVISFFSGVMASGFAFGCAKDTVEFFNAGIGEVRFPVGEGFLLVIFDYVGPWV